MELREESERKSNQLFGSLPMDIPHNRHRAIGSRHSDVGCTPKSWSDVSTGALFEMELDADECDPSSCTCSLSPQDNDCTDTLKELSIHEDFAYQGMACFPARRGSGRGEVARNVQHAPSCSACSPQYSATSANMGIPKAQKRSSRRGASSM